jgi:hypothetical protein
MANQFGRPFWKMRRLIGLAASIEQNDLSISMIHDLHGLTWQRLCHGHVLLSRRKGAVLSLVSFVQQAVCWVSFVKSQHICYEKN